MDFNCILIAIVRLNESCIIVSIGITQCEKTIYTYIEMGLFKDWGVTNLDLRRKVTRKSKKKKLKKRAETADYTKIRSHYNLIF